MRYINTLHEGETIRNVYLCKGKRYGGDQKRKTV